MKTSKWRKRITGGLVLKIDKEEIGVWLAAIGFILLALPALYNWYFG